MMIQDNWRWCHKCQGMYFAGNRSQGVCPVGHAHENRGSGDYNLVLIPTVATGQPNWRWCHKCQGLYFAGNPSPGVCPAGQAHENQGSGDYTLALNAGMPGWQNDWRWCQQCEGLAFAGSSRGGGGNFGGFGVCPASSDGHDDQGSGDYFLVQNLDLAGLLLARGPFMNPHPEFEPSTRVTNGSSYQGKVFMTVSAPDDVTVALSRTEPQHASPPPVVVVPFRKAQSVPFTNAANGSINSVINVTISADFRATAKTALLIIDPLH